MTGVTKEERAVKGEGNARMKKVIPSPGKILQGKKE